MLHTKEFENAMRSLCNVQNKVMAFAIMNVANDFTKAYALQHGKIADWKIRGDMIHKLLAHSDRQQIWEVFVKLENSKKTPVLSEDGYYGINSDTGIFIPFYQFPSDAELEVVFENKND